MNQETPPSVTAAPVVDFGRITPADRLLIEMIVGRYVPLAKRWHGFQFGELKPGASMEGKRWRDDSIELNPTILAMDLCVTHIRRNLDLRELFQVSDLELQATMAIILQHVNRRLCSFPESVRLRFARIGER